MNFFIKFFICGILTSLLFPPFFLIPIGFIIYPYLFYLINQKKFSILKFRQHFLAGFSYGVGFLCIYLGWIKEPFLLDDSTKKFSIFSYLLIFYCSLYFGLIFLFLQTIKNYFLKLLAFPLLIVISEFICANFIYGFPWISHSIIHAENTFGLSLIYYISQF